MNVAAWRTLLGAGWMVTCSAIAAPPEPVVVREFRPGDLAGIRAGHLGQRFALVAWSLDCPPCHRELARLGDALRQHPDWAVVLISTDGPGREGEIKRLIIESGVGAAEHWRFGASPAALLRRELDPRWFGELPRTWLFDQSHEVRTISGVLPEAVLERHFRPDAGPGGSFVSGPGREADPRDARPGDRGR